MKIRNAMVALAAAALIPLTAACNFPSSCEGLTASETDREAAANGYEVEKEDSLGNECELSEDGKSWSVDD